MKTIGIIGGVGPETTAEFYLDIIFGTYKRSKEQRPGVIISSIPLPYKIEEDLIERNEGGERYIPYLTEEAKRLEKAGADFLVMPCNSLHIFINEIRDSVSIPVLSIVEETVKFIKEKKYKRVGIISTSATIQNKLYENAFKEADIDYVTPNDFQQAKMGRIILNLVTGQQRNEDREEIIKIVNSFEEMNVDCVALACTDLQLLIPQHKDIPIFDTMKILVDSTIKKILSEKD
jgi:aspartate racemase